MKNSTDVWRPCLGLSPRSTIYEPMIYHGSQLPNLKSGTTAKPRQRWLSGGSVSGGMVQQSESCKVLTEVIGCDPSLPWSPTWPQQLVERMGNKGHWRGPDLS